MSGMESCEKKVLKHDITFVSCKLQTCEAKQLELRALDHQRNFLSIKIFKCKPWASPETVLKSHLEMPPSSLGPDSQTSRLQH